IVIVTESINEEISFLKKQFKHIDIHYRSGSVLSHKDQVRLNIHNASGALIYHDNKSGTYANNADEYDSRIIKSYLAINHLITEPNKTLILNFSEIVNSKFIKSQQNNNAILFNSYFFSAKFISLLTKDRSHYSIFNELLSFIGNDFHIQKFPSLTGKTFEEIYFLMNKSIPIGFFRNLRMVLIPDKKEILKEGDELIYLSFGSRGVKLTDYNKPNYDNESFKHDFKISKGNQLNNITIIGINPRLPYILEELNKEKVEIQIFGSMNIEHFFKSLKQLKRSFDINNIKYNMIDFSSEDDLNEKINPSTMQKVLVLSDENSFTYQPSNKSLDEITLFKILKIQYLKNNSIENCNFDIICEIKDPESEEIFKKILGELGDYVIGTSISAKIINLTLVHKGYLSLFYELLQKGNADLGISNFSDISQKECSFGELSGFSYLNRNMIPLGIIKEDGTSVLNPEKNLIVKNNYKIIFLYMSDFLL
ncbi:MAG: hypothetical protein KDK36_10950, partial [Leptospiraceae bacterium]|nr:hypothetical protein [Leptospiraceae bacterium]